VRTVYSIGAKFAGGGIGTTAYHAVRGLHRHGLLYRLLCGSYVPTEIPAERVRAMGWASRGLRKLATYDPRRWVSYVHNVAYDRWAAGHLEPCDVFHGWGGFSLRSLERARELGAVTIVERASSHPVYQARLLSDEYARWGLPFHMPARALQRAVAEIEWADYVLIPSDFVRQTFLQQGVPEEKLVQVSFGADTGRFRPVDSSGDPRLFRVLFVGQVGIRKGVPYLLEAWKRLNWTDAELWLVGRVDSGLGRLLTPYVKLPGVHLVGYSADPVVLFQQADVFAFPTIEEGSALVTYEALACGLPVVTTPNAGSVVRDGVEGFLVPIRDVDVLAARLEQLRANERLRREMGKAARSRVERLTWDAYGEALAVIVQRMSLGKKE